MKAIADHPPDEMYQSGKEIDCSCARCGSSVDSERCTYFACEDGWCLFSDAEDEDDASPCPECNGHPVFHRCMSSPDWCEANPLPGRENVRRGEIEWFTIE